jgi:serine/threonine protein kinase
VDRENKRPLLKHVLEDRKLKRVIVFSRTKHGANKIVDYLWERQLFYILSKLNHLRIIDQELIFLKVIQYFANYHKNNYFHGDIKPENILIEFEKYFKNFQGYEIRSDSGSFLYLMSDEDFDTPKYIVTLYSPGYASQEQIEAVEKQTPLSKR